MVGRVADRRLITYGLSEQADLRAFNIREDRLKQYFDIIYRDRRIDSDMQITDLCLPIAGKHNLQNALAAIAAGLELGASAETIAKALADFSGVKRRFSSVGEVGDNIRIFDDYAHPRLRLKQCWKAPARSTMGGSAVITAASLHAFARFVQRVLCVHERR